MWNTEHIGLYTVAADTIPPELLLNGLLTKNADSDTFTKRVQKYLHVCTCSRWPCLCQELRISIQMDPPPVTQATRPQSYPTETLDGYVPRRGKYQ